MRKIILPTTEKIIRQLRAGDEVSLGGTILTGRDLAHRWLAEKRRPEVSRLLKNSAIYHSGPVVKKVGSTYEVIAAGPTTCIREEPYQADVIRRYRLRGIIGKGGMGPKTAEACRKYGAVYFHAAGGLAALLARSITKVERVFMLDEFGVPEALWVLRIEGFPAIVTIDSRGGNLHEKVLQDSRKAAKLLARS